jgi:hypothetical protein
VSACRVSIAALASILLWPALAARSAEPAPAVSFDESVAPLLVRSCLGCHNQGQRSGELDLTRRGGMLEGGESGTPAIVPGEPDESYLIERVANGEMPPKGKGKRLGKEQVALLRRWIRAGAKWPEGRTLSPFEFTTESRAGVDWWSLKRPVRPRVPAVADASWVQTPIDAFILEKLAARGLRPAPQADRATLLRRVKLDVLGLPPTPEEIRDFVADPSPLAYERLVDRLLASPQYGERWARHWLDVVRFGESNGYETNTARPNAWPYRDYVIAALNEDIPYPQFILEQLAGDQVGADVATAFLVGGTHDVVSSPDKELTLQQRSNDLNDMLTTTATAFLGLTIGCAKCHDHKFDPIEQRDYYAMQALLAGVQHGERSIAPRLSEPERAELLASQRQLSEVEGTIATLLAEAEPLAVLAGPGSGAPPAAVRRPVDARGNVDRFSPRMAKFVRFTIRAANQFEPCLDELEIFSAEAMPRNVALASGGAKATASGVYANGTSPIHQLAHVNDGRYGNSRSWISSEQGRGWVQIELPQAVRIDRVGWARDREGTFVDRLATSYTIEVAESPGQWQVVATSDDRRPLDPLAKQSAEPDIDLLPPAIGERVKTLRAQAAALRAKTARMTPQPVYCGTFAAPGPTHLLYRGEPMQPRDEVPPGFIRAVGGAGALSSNLPEHERRLALARWIGSAENPLTARVLVNRIWHHHFGQGLVRTPGDFGFNGGRPTHPELLDYLATELVASGWSAKAIHRLILLSAAYRQSSRFDAAAAAADAGNELLWRFGPRRLEAEPIRDSILAVSGALEGRMGGPGYDVFEPNANYVKVYIPKQSFGPAEWRRMIYQNKPRMQEDATFGQFDCPDSAAPLTKRNVSTTALQALNLLNGPFLIQQAGLLADRLKREAGEDVAAQVDRAFWLAFGRAPSADEAAQGKKLVKQHGLSLFCRALLNANEFIYIN